MAKRNLWFFAAIGLTAIQSEKEMRGVLLYLYNLTRPADARIAPKTTTSIKNVIFRSRFITLTNLDRDFSHYTTKTKYCPPNGYSAGVWKFGPPGQAHPPSALLT